MEFKICWNATLGKYETETGRKKRMEEVERQRLKKEAAAETQRLKAVASAERKAAALRAENETMAREASEVKAVYAGVGLVPDPTGRMKATYFRGPVTNAAFCLFPCGEEDDFALGCRCVDFFLLKMCCAFRGYDIKLEPEFVTKEKAEALIADKLRREREVAAKL